MASRNDEEEEGIEYEDVNEDIDQTEIILSKSEGSDFSNYGRCSRGNQQRRLESDLLVFERLKEEEL